MDWLIGGQSSGLLLANPGLLLGLIGAGLGLGGSVASGLMNSASVSAANAANLQGVRETNDANRAMFDQALQYNTMMFHRQNLYNSPVEQRKRWEEAGFNPYMMMSGADAGSASSVTAPSAPSMIAPHVEPVPSALQGFTDLPNQISSFSDSALKQETTYGLSLDNKMKLVDVRNKTLEKFLQIQDQIYTIRNKKTKSQEDLAQINVLEKTARSLAIDLKYQDDFLKTRNDLQREQTNRSFFETKRAQYEAEYQRILKDKLPALQDAQIRNLAASAAASYASAEERRTASGLNMEMQKSEYYKRHNIYPLEIVSRNLAAKIQAGELNILTLGIDKAKLDAARNKDILEWRNGSLQFKDIDTAASWLGDNVLGKLIDKF